MICGIFIFWPPGEAAAEKPERDHAGEGAAGVDENVGNHRGAGGNKHLVEFIGGGVEENDENREGGFTPVPWAGIAADGFANGAPQQGGEDGVFREMAAFAKDMVDGFDMGLRHVREKPVEEGFNQPG